MVMQLRKLGDQWAIVLPPDVVEELGLADGDPVEVHKPVPAIRYASSANVLRAFDETVAENTFAYRELAK